MSSPHLDNLPDIDTPFGALTRALNQIKETAQYIHRLLVAASEEIEDLKYLSLKQTAALLGVSTRQVQYWAADPDCVLKAGDFDRRPRFSLENIRAFVASRKFRKYRIQQAETPTAETPSSPYDPPLLTQ